MEKFNLDIPKLGYVILVKHTGGFIGRAIEKAQIKAGIKPEYACYTHCEISGGGPDSVRIMPTISKMIDITKQYKGRYIHILKYDNPEFEQAKRYKIAWFAATLCNRPYDIAGVLKFLFKWAKQDNRLWFCSEGCLWAYKMVFPRFTTMLPALCMPAHFFGFKGMITHWEGIIE